MIQAQALAILKTGVNVFLTGEPGSGKTYLINEYIAYLRRRKMEHAVTASTGIAATHVGGMTIHSWSGIGVRDKLDKYDLDRITSIERVARRIENARVLIIEEISMLSANTLDMVDSVCREIRRSPDLAFGGLQVVFVGDFFQLPPVTGQDRPRAGFAYESRAWKDADPVVCYLTEQFRQDDQIFLSILKAIRSNSITEEHVEHISVRKTERAAVPDSVPRFFPHNADVDALNEQMLQKLPGEPEEFTMTGKGRRSQVETLKKGCLSPERLTLKAGAAVMFTKNHPASGFVNGTLGEVKSFNSETGLPVVKTRNNKTIRVEPMEWQLEEGGRVLAKIIQIPLRLAWAITVHKSQGISMDEAAMDLSEVFEFGQGYVALSRVRRLSGLHIFGWNEMTFQVHPEILEQDQIFRQSSDAAEIALSEMSAMDLKSRQDKFIAHCGGVLKGAYSVEEIRAKHPQAYAKWTKAEEGRLMDLYKASVSVKEIAGQLGRKPGGITSRLKKLNMLPPSPGEERD